jgi:hypothetical protein
MIQKLTFTIAIACAFAFQANAQQRTPIKKTNITSNITVKVKGGKTSVKAGEQVLLTAKGEDESEMIQWQVSADGVQWKDIPQANGNNFETPNLTSTNFYRVATRPQEGYLAVETFTNPVAITLEENVASNKKTRQ